MNNPLPFALAGSGKRRLALAGVLVCTVLASACANLEPALPAAQPAIATQWPVTAAAGSQVVADLGWRDFFVDPRLQHLIAQALANNRDLRVTALNVERARALHGLQAADRYPSANLSGGINRSGALTTSTVYSVALGVTAYELDFFGRIANLTEAAQRQVLAQEQAQRSARISLIADVAAVYLNLATDQELQRISQQTLNSLNAAHGLMEKRFQLGAASGLELSQARTLLEAARADVGRYAGLVATDFNALTLLVGAAPDAGSLPQGFNLAVSGVATLPAQLPAEVLLRRPDIAQAEFQLRATNANIGAARAAFFPSISLTGSLGTASRELGDLFQSGTGIWSFIPQIRLPIFQGERLQANLGVATADRDIALARYEKAIQSGFREVADALALNATLTERRQALQALLAAATQAQQISQARYDAGRDSFLVVLDAQRTLYSAQQGLAAILLAEQANRVTLYKVLGGGLRERSS